MNKTYFLWFTFGLERHWPDIHLNSSKAFAVILFQTLKHIFSVDYLTNRTVKQVQHWHCSGRGEILLKKQICTHFHDMEHSSLCISLVHTLTFCMLTLHSALLLHFNHSATGSAEISKRCSAPVLQRQRQGRKKGPTLNSNFSKASNEFSCTWAEQIQ